MNILAPDPGIANCGVAFNEGESRFHFTVVTKPGVLEERIHYILTELDKLQHHIDLVVMEDFVGHLGKSTVYLIGALIGLCIFVVSVIILLVYLLWSP